MGVALLNCQMLSLYILVSKRAAVSLEAASWLRELNNLRPAAVHVMLLPAATSEAFIERSSAPARPW